MLAWIPEPAWEFLLDALVTFTALCVAHISFMTVEWLFGEPGIGRVFSVFYRRWLHIDMDVIAPLWTLFWCVIAVLDNCGVIGE